MLAGIGFTIALFISELAYSTDQINAAKLGIYSASICSALLGLTFLRYFSVEKNRTTSESEMYRQSAVKNYRRLLPRNLRRETSL
ncbi:Na+/H+ antiporter NhaA [Vibrio parahaemolyticus]